MNNYYKLIFVGILIYIFTIIKNTSQRTNLSNFSLPQVKVQQAHLEQKENADKKDKFSLKKTIESGLGAHDRIRYKGSWN